MKTKARIVLNSLADLPANLLNVAASLPNKVVIASKQIIATPARITRRELRRPSAFGGIRAGHAEPRPCSGHHPVAAATRHEQTTKKGQSMKSETSLNKRNKNNGRKNASRRIHFEFESATAESVAIAGTFNEWQPVATPMIALGSGRWAKDLSLPPGNYEYCLVVDGQWRPDPLAAEYVPNPFGGMNSICKVGNGG